MLELMPLGRLGQEYFRYWEVPILFHRSPSFQRSSALAQQSAVCICLELVKENSIQAQIVATQWLCLSDEPRCLSDDLIHR